MGTGYRIAICGVQSGYAEEQVATALSPQLKHPAEELVPVLRARKRISVNIKGLDLRGARAMKERLDKTGCASTLESTDPMPPKAPLLPGNFEGLDTRTFVNRAVELVLQAPVDWRDGSDEGLFKVHHTGTRTYVTSSLNRTPGFDLQVHAEIRFGVVPDKMSYLKAYREPYTLETAAGPGIVAEFRGTVPGDAEPTHQLILCLRPEAGFVSFSMTSTVDDFEKHQALYQWLLRTQLRLWEVGDDSADGHQHPAAQFDIGVKFARADNHAEAVTWFRRAAEQGYAQAQYALGCCYARGDGVAQDTRQAFVWWLKAAEGGNRSAQYNVACAYASGDGVAEDDVQSSYWYQKGAEQGDADAQYAVAQRYCLGVGVEESPRLAAHWALQAAEQGHSGAQFYVGFVYERGDGVTPNAGTAVWWYRKAAAQGHAKAKEQLQALGAQ